MDKFKAVMILSNITIEDLMLLLGVKRSYINRRLSGKAELTLSEVEKICRQYNVKPSYILDT